MTRLLPQKYHPKKKVYQPAVGVSLKYLHGDPTTTQNKVVCMSAFHLFIENKFVSHTVYYKYIQYLLLSVSSINSEHRDWTVRIYTDTSVSSAHNPESVYWQSVFSVLKKMEGVQIIQVEYPHYYNDLRKCHPGLLPAFFRYLVLFDTESVGKIDVCVFRDIDNVWTEQDFWFIQNWVDSESDGMMYLDNTYRKQEIVGLTDTDVIRDGEMYLSVFAGVWGYRLRGVPLPSDLWHRMVYYIETSNSFVYKPVYSKSKFYQCPFIYGFEELALSRILIPALISRKKSFYSIPIKIWNTDAFQSLFDDKLRNLHILIGMTEKIRNLVKDVIVNQYWDMYSSKQGRAQFLLCILTNIYFRIITGQAPRFTTEFPIYAEILRKIYPTPFLMSIGMFVFKNLLKYQWYNPHDPEKSGSVIVGRVVAEPEYEIDWTEILER